MKRLLVIPVVVLASLLVAAPAGAEEEPVVGAAGGSSVIAVDHDGDTVLFTSGSRNIDPLVDARHPQGTYLWTPTTLGRLDQHGSVGIDVTADGRTAAVQQGKTLGVLSVDDFDGVHVIAEGICCSSFSISDDARYIAYTGSPLDPDAGVFVHDRTNGSTARVGDGDYDATISGDGTAIAWRDYPASFVRDLPDGEPELLTPDSGGLLLSADGDTVAYTRFEDDVTSTVVRDRTTGEETVIEGAAASSMSADGTKIAYTSGPGLPQAHVHDLTTGQSTLVSRTPTGAPGDSGSVFPEISGDGRTVVFESAARDLVPGVVYGPYWSELFKADLDTGEIELLTPGRDAGLQQLRTDGFVNSYGAAQPRTPDPRLDRAVAIASPPYGNGFWVANTDGHVARAGYVRHHGEVATPLARPIVDMASSRTGDGYWLVASDGGIFTFGDATFFGSTGAMRLNQPIVGMAPTPSGDGYWLVASDGGIFTFGDAEFFGSTGAMRLNRPIVAMARTRTGDGYWLVASDGGIFSFGDATFHGSTGAVVLNQPIVAVVRTFSGRGYRLIARDGGVFAFGDASHIWGPSDPRCANVCIVDAASA